MNVATLERELILPPPGIPRHGGRSDSKYVELAKLKIEKAQAAGLLQPDSRILDIGCGAGRFLTGMLATYGRVNKYVGLDVRRRVIDWCNSALTEPANGDVRFEWINVDSPRYNRKAPGRVKGETFRFPLEDRSFDLVVLYSVFSHMTFEDTRNYLKEIARVMDHGGYCRCSAFVEYDVPDWVENPQGYLGRKWRRPLHCARFNKVAFDGLVAEAGLKIVKFGHRLPPVWQSSYTLALATN